ncbi:MAG: hydroxymethylbilane synthase [Legionella sp.]|nr:hydroxymethylbilane synthase [Legionella sp.]
MTMIRIATRQSPLALQQSRSIAEKIKIIDPSVCVKLIPMKTTGDRFQQAKLSQIGTKGLFVKELEEALLNGDADIAVHSMKDVPTFFPEGLFLAAICERANPYDAFIARANQKLHSLATGAIIGTSSLRRQSQLLVLRPDLVVKELRGNVGSRLAKLNAGQFDAIVLAVAGLQRLGCDVDTEILTEDQMMPAGGQGALGIECREKDLAIIELLQSLHHPVTGLCVEAERQVSLILGGNCHAPIAVYCKPYNDTKFVLRARVLSSDGKQMLEEHCLGEQKEVLNLSKACASRLLARGAAELVAGSS